jgi:HSP20 family protein
MALPILSRGIPVGLAPGAGHPFGGVGRTMDRLLDDLWSVGAPASAAPGGFVPRIDVVEDEDGYRVTAELPGLEEKDFQVEAHGNVLTISGEKRTEREEGARGWRWSERSYGAFRRSVELPLELDASKASASFKNGVLTVTAPKAEHARVRHIPVNNG